MKLHWIKFQNFSMNKRGFFVFLIGKSINFISEKSYLTPHHLHVYSIIFNWNFNATPGIQLVSLFFRSHKYFRGKMLFMPVGRLLQLPHFASKGIIVRLFGIGKHYKNRNSFRIKKRRGKYRKVTFLAANYNIYFT